MENVDKIDVLNLLTQPAFIVKNDQILQVNQPAAQRFIIAGTDIKSIIDTGAEDYAEFRTGCLYLTLKISGQECGASVTKINETDIFILEDDADNSELRTMALAAKELRIPLASIMTTADRLFPMLSCQESGANDQIAQINKGLFQMLRVISNMSDAATFATAGSRMEVRDICSVLDEVFGRAQELVQHTGISLHFTNLPGTIYCLTDADKLERAVYNIISNALKFTPKGGTITANLVRKANKLLLSVQDSGSGIPSGLLSSIYSRFQREPAIEDTRFGIGLGMVLIRSTAAIHGGTVLIDQPTGEGTRITMTLQIRNSSEITLSSPRIKIDYAGERDHGLIELSESLPYSLYRKENIN